MASDVPALLQSRRLVLGQSGKRDVVRALGRHYRSEEHLLLGKMSHGGDLNNRWTTLDYPELGIECLLVGSAGGLRLSRMVLKPPYQGTVFDSWRLGQKTVGQLALEQRTTTLRTSNARNLQPCEVEGYVSIGNVQLGARMQLDSALWSRCHAQPAVLDSVIRSMPVNRVILRESRK